MNDPLFQPIIINGMEVKNRIFMPAMHMNMAVNYAVTDRLVDFYAERARGGAGLITVGYATADECSGNPGNIGAHQDSHIPGLARLAAAIRENGARSSVQLNHAGRYNHSMLMAGKDRCWWWGTRSVRPWCSMRSTKDSWPAARSAEPLLRIAVVIGAAGRQRN